MIVIGDVHGHWGQLGRLAQRLNFSDDTIIQAGDFGVGFDAPAHEQTRLRALNDLLAARNLHLSIIRGNHDDPSYFVDGRHNLSHVCFVPDYTLLTVGERRVLCVGGAVSEDRLGRRRRGLPWWPDEAFRLQGGDGLDAPDIVITHSAPDFCPPPVLSPLVERLARYDPRLPADLHDERAGLTTLFETLDRSQLQIWVYAHFHAAFQHEHAGVVFHGLSELGRLRLT